MPINYAKELGAMKPGKMMGESEPANDDYSEAKEMAGRDLATALGIDPETIDARALCEAVKAIVELEE